MLLKLYMEHAYVLDFCEVPVEDRIDLFVQIIYHVAVSRETHNLVWVVA